MECSVSDSIQPGLSEHSARPLSTSHLNCFYAQIQNRLTAMSSQISHRRRELATALTVSMDAVEQNSNNKILLVKPALSYKSSPAQMWVHVGHRVTFLSLSDSAVNIWVMSLPCQPKMGTKAHSLFRVSWSIFCIAVFGSSFAI